MRVRIESELATESEFAQELRVPVRVVAEMRRRGDIEYVKAGRNIRIPWQEVNRVRIRPNHVRHHGPDRPADQLTTEGMRP